MSSHTTNGKDTMDWQTRWIESEQEKTDLRRELELTRNERDLALRALGFETMDQVREAIRTTVTT